MKILPKIKRIQCRCNAFITRQLRKVSIFQRLNISFLVLLLGTAVFLTFFSFSKYSAEIIFNLERYASMSVQNIQLKVQDIMQEYEEIAVQFYEDEEVLRAVAENVTGVEGSDVFRQNRHIVESKLYHMGHGKKYIKSIQMVSAGKQYHMAEENGYQRGGTIRNLDEFYQSNFYQEAKAVMAIRCGLKMQGRTIPFMRVSRVFMDWQTLSRCLLQSISRRQELF